MCGINGLLGSPEFVRSCSIERMNQALAHRGPDDTGIWRYDASDGSVALGHQRLSILDLSMAGHQPMSTEDGQYTLVFNGEIYNFQSLAKELRSSGVHFRSHSDTEVLLHGLARQGESFLSKLEGMFAFAFFNKRTNELLLARDPAGIKPLYVRSSKHGIAFSSEMRALLSTGGIPAELDYTAIRGFLAFGAMQQPSTLIRSIRMLGAGVFEKYRLGGSNYAPVETKRYWKYPSHELVCSQSDAVFRTQELLSDSVRDHLIADVSVGVFLSAGVDSTLLTALARRNSDSVRAFTIDLEGACSDEGTIAVETAKRLDVHHTLLKVSESEARQLMEAWLRETDAPSIDGLNTYVISKAVRSEGIKVALSGVGADELFGGYSSFRDNPKIQKLSRCIRFLPNKLKRLVANAMNWKGTRESRDKLADMLVGGTNPIDLALLRRRLLSDKTLDALLKPEVSDAMASDASSLSRDAAISDGSLASQSGWATGFAEFIGYQQNMLLRDSDAASMAHSLEIRVPFLDQRIIDWVPRLSDAIRFPPGESGKYLLKKAFESELGRSQLTRPKTGFELPFVKWMAGPLRDVCRGYLDSVAKEDFVEPKAVYEIWDHFLANPYTGSATRALALVSLGANLRVIRGLG